MYKNFKNIIIYVFLPIIGGSFIYYLFCPNILFVKFIDDFLGKGFHVQVNFSNIFMKLFRNYFMDFIWAFSFLAFILFTFAKEFKTRSLIFLVFAVEVFLELAQSSACVIGTYDICDIFVEIIANIIVILLWRKRKNEKI